MQRYIAPAGIGESEITEKRSRFIGRVVPVDSESAAKEEIAKTKAKHRDARHNCWCYVIRGGPERCSDDGEPQGSAGQPMLEIFKRGEISNVCCIVTRYFGGVLLGTGGLSRAYSEAAKLALADAGKVEYHLRDSMEIICPYNLLGRIKSEIETHGGTIDRIEYAEHATLHVTTPEGESATLKKRITDASAGIVTGC